MYALRWFTPALAPDVGSGVIVVVGKTPECIETDHGVDVQPANKILLRRKPELALQQLDSLVGCPVISRDAIGFFGHKECKPAFSRGHAPGRTKKR
jgi:hypothetical protein